MRNIVPMPMWCGFTTFRKKVVVTSSVGNPASTTKQRGQIMATAAERDQAIAAVRGGNATDAQKEVVRVAAQQAGSVGDDARAAREGR